MAESTQKKLERVRAPRVKLTYDVEIGDAVKQVELPLVVGVMADLTGQPETPLKRLSDREFVMIDRDNFDEVLAGAAPHLSYRVNDVLSGEEDSSLGVKLRFKSREDFEPHKVVAQVEPLRKLKETREHLLELLAKLEGKEDTMELLDDILADMEKTSRLKAAYDGPTEE